MTGKKRGLGRGLDALLSPDMADIADVGDAGEQGLVQLPVEFLRKGRFQPRTDMDPEALESLAASIRSQGVVQPVVVRRLAGTDNNRYEIVAGERRWRAAQMAGLQEIPVVVRDIPDETAMAMALIENIQREDLNPLDEAQALRRLVDEFELTHQEAAQAIGRSRAAVSNLLRLLELGDAARDALRRRELEMGHARALLALDKPRMQAEVARLVVTRGLSVRETERLIKRVLAGESTKTATKQPALDPDIRRLQDELSETLGAQVAIQHTARGKGKLVVSYSSVDELEGILAHIG
jgi:ParB family chromosome partitioning protein